MDVAGADHALPPKKGGGEGVGKLSQKAADILKSRAMADRKNGSLGIGDAVVLTEELSGRSDQGNISKNLSYGKISVK